MTSPPTPPPDPNAGGQPARRFRETALASGLVTAGQIDVCEAEVSRSLGITPLSDPPRWDAALAARMVHRKLLTRFQADQFAAGRSKLTLGQYVILDELGRGGMGRVFRARHAMMGRMVAIKVLPREKSNADTEAAFQREIRMLGRLDHENLVRALDAGHDGKVYYLVTELIPGLDLRRQVIEHGRLTEAAAASVISQAAEGLSYAHSQGLVHRDVKPSNLLVTPDGWVKVLDLGLAGSVLEDESTRVGRIVGTMDYMAPEQIQTPDAVGPQADVYALGCTLYFALTGKVPFPGGTRQEKAKRQMSEQPKPIHLLRPGIDEGMCRVVEAMMRKDPRERWQSARMVIDGLCAWKPPQPVPMPRSEAKRAANVGAPGAGSGIGSLSKSGMHADGGATDPSQASQQITGGGGSAEEETWRSAGPSVGQGDAVGRAKHVPGASPQPAVTSPPTGVLSSLARLTAKLLRCVAIAVVVGTVTAVATRRLGIHGGGMPGWAAFWVVLSWQARDLFGRGRADGGPRSG